MDVTVICMQPAGRQPAQIREETVKLERSIIWFDATAVTVKVCCTLVFPVASFAVQLTVVAPSGNVLPLGWLRWVVALSLLAVGIDGLWHHRHIRLAGMRVGARELATWSFLMASAHGAGLMVLPFVLGTATTTGGAMQHHHAAMSNGGDAVRPLAAGIAGLDPVTVLAPLVHTFGYLLVTFVLAVVVYEKIGLKILRRAWINVNVIWSAALIVAAVAAVMS